jgi:hypothetical protein
MTSDGKDPKKQTDGAKGERKMSSGQSYGPIPIPPRQQQKSEELPMSISWRHRYSK